MRRVVREITDTRLALPPLGRPDVPGMLILVLAVGVVALTLVGTIAVIASLAWGQP